MPSAAAVGNTAGIATLAAGTLSNEAAHCRRNGPGGGYPCLAEPSALHTADLRAREHTGRPCLRSGSTSLRSRDKQLDAYHHTDARRAFALRTTCAQAAGDVAVARWLATGSTLSRLLKKLHRLPLPGFPAGRLDPDVGPPRAPACPGAAPPGRRSSVRPANTSYIDSSPGAPQHRDALRSRVRGGGALPGSAWLRCARPWGTPHPSVMARQGSRPVSVKGFGEGGFQAAITWPPSVRSGRDHIPTRTSARSVPFLHP